MLQVRIAATPVLGGIAGHVTLTPEQRAATREQPLVVYAIEPGKQEPEETSQVVTIRRQSGPPDDRPLVVSCNQGVRFVNEDSIHHRFFSSTHKNQFDLGSLGQGGSALVRFRNVGEVRYYCSLHSGEGGAIHVVPSPRHCVVDVAGKFEIEGLSAGNWELRTYHKTLPMRRLGVRVIAGITRSVRLDFSTPPAWPANR